MKTYKMYKITLFQMWNKKQFECFYIEVENKKTAVQIAKNHLRRTKYSTEVYFEVN